MYVIIWEFQVKSGSEYEFEQAYGAHGKWVECFRRSAGYFGSELLRDLADSQHYLTIDRWHSQAAWETFQRQWSNEYQALDQYCETLTEHEAVVGSLVLVSAQA